MACENKVGKRRVYISGPMRGKENHNRHKFNEWENIISGGGTYCPVNPVKIGDAIASPRDIEENPELMNKVLSADINALDSCDAIFMLDGWQGSKGARRELQHALDNGKEVLLESEFLAKEEEYDAMKLAARMERFSNRFGVYEELKRLAAILTNMHPTLVQSFTSGFIFSFVKKMAEKCRCDRLDDRDKAACVVCEAMWNAVEDKYDLDRRDDLKLPMA